MAWLVGLVTQTEKLMLLDRGWELHKVDCYSQDGGFSRLFGGPCDPPEDGEQRSMEMVYAYADVDLFAIASSAPDWKEDLALSSEPIASFVADWSIQDCQTFLQDKLGIDLKVLDHLHQDDVNDWRNEVVRQVEAEGEED